MAFCGSCGNEVADGVKFCPHCGKDTGVAAASTEGSAQVVPGAKVQMDVFKIVSLVIMGITMISIFLPTLSMSAFGETESVNIIQLWEAKIGFLYYVFVLIATLGCIVCIGMGAKVLYDIFMKNSNANEKQMIHLSMWGEVAAMVAVLIVSWIMNSEIKKMSYGFVGGNICGLSFMGWLMLILALLNIFVVTNKSITDKIMGMIKK